MTYHGLCDVCVWTTKGDIMIRCPLLLMMWSFERFNIDRPHISSFTPYEAEFYQFAEYGMPDLEGGPTMSLLWYKRDVSISNCVLVANMFSYYLCIYADVLFVCSQGEFLVLHAASTHSSSCALTR